MKSSNSKTNKRYVFHEELGRGGMGVVYRVTDRLLAQVVALKQVHLDDSTAISDSVLRLVLAQEFQTLASLRHPYIISVLDYGFDGAGQPYFTMDYLAEAQTLLAAGAEQQLRQKIELLLQLLEALAYLHRRGILHRDLKPSNVLVAGERVRLLDFGLAAHKQGQTTTGGSLAYMAPELLRGEAASEATDLYAVGMMASQLFMRHEEKLAEPLREVIACLLAQESSARYKSAEAALLAFHEALGLPLAPEHVAIRESYLQAATFIGREAEMAQLSKALHAAQADSGSAWLIGGESGVGKSRLASELRIQALVEGFLVLQAQALPDSSPYQLWRDVIRRLLLNGEVSDLTAAILQPLVPDIERLLGRQIPTLPILEGKAGQERLYRAISDFFEQQTQPILLLLEDLQWSTTGEDESESVIILKKLTQIVNERPILIIATYRDDEVPTLPAQLPQMQPLSLARLSSDEIAALTVAMLGQVGAAPQLLARLQEETEGNAFFLVEVVRLLAQEAGRLSAIGDISLPKALLSDGIQSIIQRRLARVPANAQALLLMAALIGRQLDLSLLAYLIRQEGLAIALEQWLVSCADAAILDVEAGSWRFTHDKLRLGLLAGLTPAERATSHRTIAQATTALYPDDPEQAANLVYHWHHAGEREKERSYAIIAGNFALGQFANQDAIRYLSRALQLTPEREVNARFELLAARERVYDLLAKREAQAQDLKQLSHVAATLAVAPTVAEIARRQAFYRIDIGNYTSAIEMVQQALSYQPPASLQAALYRAWGQALWHLSDYEGAGLRYKQGLRLAQQSQEQKIAGQLLYHLATVGWGQGDYTLAKDYSIQALDVSRTFGDARTERAACNLLGNLSLDEGNYTGAISYYQQALSVNRVMGDPKYESLIFGNLGAVYQGQGAYAKAQSNTERALQLSRKIKHRQSEGTWLLNLGLIFHLMGDNLRALQHNQSGLQLAQQLGNRRLEGYTLTNQGHILAALGQLEQAQASYSAALALRREIGQHHLAIESQAGLASVLLLQGQGRDALTEVEEVIEAIEADKLQGTEEPFRLYLTCYRVLHANQDQRFVAILHKAYRLLQEQAAKMSTPAMQRTFLQHVPHHRALVDAFDKLYAQPSSDSSVNPIANIQQSPNPSLLGTSLLTYVITVSRRMAEMHSLEPLLAYAMDEVLDLVGAEQGYIVLLQADGSLDYRVKRDQAGNDWHDEGSPISHSILEQVIKSHQPLVISNAMMDPRFWGAHSVLSKRLRSVICVPLMTQQRMIGAIYVENRTTQGQFCQRDAQPLELFANQAAVAIENAQLHQQAEQEIAARKKTEAILKAYSQRLEEMVAARTKELSERNLQLEAQTRALAQAKSDAEAQKVKAQLASHAKSEFLSNMSHELRTPLNGILGYTQNLKRSPTLSHQQKNSLESIHQSGHYLLSLINDILDLSKIEARKMELNKQALYLPHFFQSIVRMLQIKADEKNLRFAYQLEPGIPLTVQGDAKRLRQILINLLGNAIKFTEEGQVTLRIGMVDKAPHKDDHITLRFEVLDTGIGIKAEQLEGIFLPFEQVGKREQQLNGTGLGLAITQKLVNLMGSEIKVESRLGQGTKFWFDLSLSLSDTQKEKKNAAITATQRGQMPPGAKETSSKALQMSQKLTIPPSEQLKILYKFASLGMMSSIRKQLDEIEQLHVNYSAFTAHIRHLAQTFEDEKILTLIEECLEETTTAPNHDAKG